MEKPTLEVYKAIAAITGELAKVGISKDKINQQQGFKYRGIDQVYDALSPLLSQHNLCILPRIVGKDVVERMNSKGTALFYTTVEAQFDLVSAVDGSTHTVISYGGAMDSGDKSIGKAMSYAYKAMAFMLFAIPVEGDNDPDATSHEVQPKKPATTASQPPQATSSDFKDAEYIGRLTTALKAIYGDNKARALDKVEELTSFVPSGKTEAERVKGVRDFTKLKGKRLEILTHNIEKMVPKQDEQLPTFCAECLSDPCVCGDDPF
jgi:hypothetical protein